MNGQGILIALEGTDGSGKTTQTTKLVERLKSEGYDVASFAFPRYDQSSSYFITQYLNGAYGGIHDVNPYTASMFFALDRYDAAADIRAALAAGKVVIANRYTGSNMAHQGTKFTNTEERRGFFLWLDHIEFQMFGVSRPTKSFVLRMPAEMAQELVDYKPSRTYTDKKRDIHEADLEHLTRAVEVYDDLCQLFPKDFTRLDCVRSGKLLDVDTIHEQLWEMIKPLLPQKGGEPMPKKARAAAAADNPYITSEGGRIKVTAAGQKYLREIVTNDTSNIYAFTDKLSPLTIAAAMARLSRRGDDMRVTILDEFSTKAGRDEQLLQRVITAYGDDSVQQLAGQYIVVEGASNLLTKKLEWGRLGAYLEQSTRYIYLDEQDEQGNYRYYIPDEFDADTKRAYCETMDKIFKLYSEMVHAVTKYVRDTSTVSKKEQDAAWQSATRAQACDAVRPVLPVALRLSVGIYDSAQALESLITHLLSDRLPEARQAGQQILEEARKVLPAFLERTDKPERGGATIAYRADTYTAMHELAVRYLPDRHAAENEPVQLVSFWPRNELDLLADMLYEHSSLPLAQLREEIAGWPMVRKEEVFRAYMGERLNRRHKPGRALEKAHYSWDLVCDYGIFRDLQRHRMVDDLQWQQLTPRYGYDMPGLIEEAGLTEQFEACFDLSLQLYSRLQAAGYELEAQYATLLGHKMRWKVTYNAREAFHIHELRTSPQGHPGYRKLVQQMHEKLSEVHPLLGDAMKFVNQGEDPELTRLAAERYTQFKLRQLDR